MCPAAQVNTLNLTENFKRLDDACFPLARGWQKHKVRETTEAIVGAATGPLAAPRSLLLGRSDAAGRPQYTGRTTTLARTAGTAIAGQLTAARRGHPWTGWSFSAGQGSRETPDVTPAEPEPVVEVGVDIARGTTGRWRHPAHWHRIRAEMHPMQVTKFEESDEPPGSSNAPEQA
ncbi:hypothetical protein [Streptomyces atratus]|uniref:hypothetical protein n=1 Tax=Streptomyces atratus TaxID=1893 RepID=UPI003660144C